MYLYKIKFDENLKVCEDGFNSLDSNISSQKMKDLQIENSTSENGIVIYSLVGKRHIAAVTDVK